MSSLPDSSHRVKGSFDSNKSCSSRCFQCTAGVPLWITEIVPPKHRGILGDIHAIGLNVGYCISAYVGVGFFYTDQPNAWRPPIALQILPPLVVLLGIYWIPESPRWLLTKGRDDQAWEIIRRLHTSSHDADDSFAQAEFRQMKIQIEFEATLESSYMYILKRPSMRKRALMTMFLTFSMFSTGILVVNSEFIHTRQPGMACFFSEPLTRIRRLRIHSLQQSWIRCR